MTAFDDLLVVQELDTTADQLRHRLETLPARARVAAADARRQQVEAGIADAETRRGVVRRDQSRLEDEVASTEEKERHVEGQLYGGSVTSPKELEALQHELDMLRGRQREIEDHVIEQMELAEPLDAELAELAAELDATERERIAAQAELDAESAAIDAELASVVERRSGAVAGLPGQLVEQYESIRDRSEGVGAARLAGTRCEGCHLAIPSAQLDELKRAPADEVILCPECLRILVR
ncbi:MAG TPA: C4-type zinc ribbon domain-containing protein [Microthrixaceae bacterium]|nr:C4-type zinc ribbon domain-containing protein [Microthrixaceae bacterium]